MTHRDGAGRKLHPGPIVLVVVLVGVVITAGWFRMRWMVAVPAPADTYSALDFHFARPRLENGEFSADIVTDGLWGRRYSVRSDGRTEFLLLDGVAGPEEFLSYIGPSGFENGYFDLRVQKSGVLALVKEVELE